MQQRFFIAPNISQYFMQGTQSMKTKEMLLLSIIPFCVALVAWIGFIAFGINKFDFFLQQFPNIWVQYSLQDGIANQISYWILMLFACIFMLLCATIVFGVCIVFLGCFISPFVVSFVHKKSFQHIAINPPTFLDSLKLSSMLFCKTLLKFILFSILCYALSFIGLGLIGVIISIFIYFRFFSVNINHEIGVSIMQKEEYEIFLQYNKVPLFFINILLFIPLYIPVLNLFITTWQMLVLSHFMFDWYAQFLSSQQSENAEYIEIIE